MRILISLIAVGVLALGSTAMANPDETTGQPAATNLSNEVSEAVVAPPEDPMVCRAQRSTGSSIPVKVCMKQSQWVAKSKRRGSAVGEIRHADGMDNSLAPLPPSN